MEAGIAAELTAQRILRQPKELKEYNQNPEKVIERHLRGFGLTADELAVATPLAQREIEETKEVLPGLTREEARSMLLGSLGAPKSAFAIYTWLNLVLFATGVALVAVGVGFAIKGENTLLTGMVGGSGIFTAGASTFLRDPLKRIANSASDHSQIRTVVLSFWVQVANWRTEVLEPNVVDEDVVLKVNADIREATDHAVTTLQRYAENKDDETSRQVTELTARIESLENSARVTTTPTQ